MFQLFHSAKKVKCRQLLQLNSNFRLPSLPQNLIHTFSAITILGLALQMTGLPGCLLLLETTGVYYFTRSRVGRNSVVGIATCFWLAERSWDRNPVGAKFYESVETGHPASYTVGKGPFPGLKWPGCGVDHAPLSSAGVNERVELYLCPLLGLHDMF